MLGHYGQFKDLAQNKRDRLEEARQFQYFKRDADELEIWILEKLQTASEESYRDPTNLQVSSILDGFFDFKISLKMNNSKISYLTSFFQEKQLIQSNWTKNYKF